VKFAPELLRHGLGSLVAADGDDAVRVDPLVDSVALSTHDATIGLWRAVVVGTLPDERATDDDAESVTVALEDLYAAVPPDGASSVSVRTGSDGVVLAGIRVRRVEDRPAPPQSADFAAVELVLPEDGPAVIDVRTETRLVLGPPLVDAFRTAEPMSAKAFVSDGRWFLAASTGPDLSHDPLLVAEAASFALGTE